MNSINQQWYTVEYAIQHSKYMYHNHGLECCIEYGMFFMLMVLLLHAYDGVHITKFYETMIEQEFCQKESFFPFSIAAVLWNIRDFYCSPAIFSIHLLCKLLLTM